MFDRAQLEAFSAVVQHGSFERAATVLNVTRGAISQRIKSLEEAHATILVVRERPVVATRMGEILLRHIRALKALEDDILSAISYKQHDRAPAFFRYTSGSRCPGRTTDAPRIPADST